MDVRTLCLAVLSAGDASGYEIRKALQEPPLGQFQDAAYGSIYPALSKLSEEGLVSGTAFSQEKRPDKKVYSLTSAGEMALRSALLVAPTPDKFRSDFLLLLYLADRLPVEFARQLVDQRISEYEGRLERMENCGECLEHPGHRFVHGFAQSLYRAALAYLNDNRERFSAELVELKTQQKAAADEVGAHAPTADVHPTLLAGE